MSELPARWRPLLVGAAIALGLTGVVYANALHHPFHFDDGHSVQDNAWIRSLRHVPRFLTDVRVFSPLEENRSYRPVLLLSYALSWALGGGRTWGFHLWNIAVHALGALAVGALVRRVLSEEVGEAEPATRAGWLATALWSVHPLLSEPVNYVSARSSHQAAVLMVLAVVLHIDARRHGRRGAAVLSPVVLLLAMGTKIIAMTAPALLLAWELLYGPDRAAPDRLRRWARALLPATVVAVGFTMLHETMVGSANRAARSDVGPLPYLLTQVQVWLHFLGLWVWPEDLCADRTMVWARHVWEGPVARALLAHAGLIGAALAAGRRWPWVGFGLLWYYVALSPTNSIVPLAEPATEHRVYVALPGVALITVGLGRELHRRWERSMPRGAAAVAVVALVVALGARTHVRNRVWSSPRALWSDVVARSPDNGRAHLNLGLALIADGALEAGRTEIEACAERWPGYVFCWINLAVVALRLKDQDGAERAIARAEQIRPENVYVREWRGWVELAARRWTRAIAAFRWSLAVAPGYPGAELGLARALFEAGQLEEAGSRLDSLAEAGRLDAEGHFARGYLADRAGASERARAEYEAALTLDPGLARARYNLAVLDHRAGRLDVAIAAYRALAAVEPVAPEVWENLARALEARGDPAGAAAARAAARR